MPIELIKFQGQFYPKFQASGHASRFVKAIALEYCKGYGYDIGCGKPEWSLPGSFLIDPVIDENFNAMNLPDDNVDYIFSSHCLEHLDDWVSVLNYWHSKLKSGGVLFLYLPDFSQFYWRAWNNRKHKSVFTPEIIEAYLMSKFIKVQVSGVDLNNSFCAVAEK